VNDLVQQAGGVYGLGQVLSALTTATTADPTDVTALGLDRASDRPQKGQTRARGTGAGSTSKRAASV
jgi:hypothetical protein